MNTSKEELQQIIESEIHAAELRFGKEFKVALLKILALEKMLNPDKPEKQSRVIPLSEWDKYHNYPTIGSLRQFYFHRDTNGFEYCVEYGGASGGTILINEDKYFEWQRNRKKLKK